MSDEDGFREYLATRNRTNSPKGKMVSSLQDFDNPFELATRMANDEHPEQMPGEKKTAIRLLWEYNRWLLKERQIPFDPSLSKYAEALRALGINL